VKKDVTDPEVIDYLYDESLEGTEMEGGSSSEGSLWFGGMTLNGDDYQVLEDAGIADYGEYNHVIITEDTQGFRRAELYETRAEYDEAFGVYEEEFGIGYDEDF
jgi:hypothetical protein